ncbi:MAG: hypothetical protein ACOYT4_01460 [Nanoarchaeota archaeon]
MLPKWHILFGFVFSYILVYFFRFSLLSGLIIFLSSILIDIDHYFYYMIKYNYYNPFTFYEKAIARTKTLNKLSYSEKRKYKLGIFIFHGIEFWIILISLSFWHNFFLFILIGVFIHMIADIPDEIYHQFPFYSKISPIYTLIKNSKKQEFK